ncbi:MAG TPA: hypothetical protein PKL84_17495, partial [Candidatus Hydrogenedentes bacterium]|nr:hypothetical protein [Candidatus Hydrogenedentota bacterium]
MKSLACLLARRVVCVLAIGAVALFGDTAPALEFLEVTSNADSGEGSLREAITIANGNGVPDIIVFDLPVGEELIAPLSPLPALTEANTTISRFMGAVVPDALIIDGQFAGDADGLIIQAAGIVIDGLTIISFERSGIVAEGAGTSDFRVSNCLVGTDGIECFGNRHHGILVRDGANGGIIGGYYGGNVISGNGYDGIRIVGENTSYVYVSGNRIGTNSFGSLPIGNGWRSDDLRGIWVAPRSEEGEGEGEGEGDGALRAVPKETNAEGIELIDGFARGGGILIAFGASSNGISGNIELEPSIIAGNYW